MSEGVWGDRKAPHSQPIIYESIKNNVVYYNKEKDRSYAETVIFCERRCV